MSRSCIALECSLSDHELDRKRRALAARGSQTEQLATIMGETAYRTWWGDERFRRPTRSEIDSCPVRVWMQQATTRNCAMQPALVGGSARCATFEPDIHIATNASGDRPAISFVVALFHVVISPPHLES